MYIIGFEYGHLVSDFISVGCAYSWTNRDSVGSQHIKQGHESRLRTQHIEAGIRKNRKQISSDDEEYAEIQKEEIKILKEYIK